MNIQLLEKLSLLPPDKQKEVENFVEILLKNSQKTDDRASDELIEKRRSNLGRLKGQIWMADDFNETPEDFKDYI